MVVQATGDATYLSLLHDIPATELPRERMLARGAKALSDVELMAILLRTGSRGEHVIDLAKRLLRDADGLEGLGRLSLGELVAMRNVGRARAAQLMAAIELGRRIGSVQPHERPVIAHPGHVFALLGADMALLDQEELRVILMNTRHQVMGVRELYKGSAHTVAVRVGEVFRDAIRENCPNVIVVHNHPSGDPTPSHHDVSLTREMYDAGRLLGIDLVDHVIITRKGPYSLHDAGIGFPKT